MTDLPTPKPDLVPATKKTTTFLDLPGEVRTEVYELCVDDHLKRPFALTAIHNVTSILPGKIHLPDICRVNRSIRAEALTVFFARARWAVNGGIPTVIGAESILNGLNVYGMGVGLGYGSLKNIGVPDHDLLVPPGGGRPFDWVCNQRFFPDDVAMGTWESWCKAVEGMGKEAENAVSKLRVRTYAHRMCRPYVHGMGGLWNEFGLLDWDIDLIESNKRQEALLRGILTKSMVRVVADAEVFLEELVAPLREKRVQGLLRIRDVKMMVEEFTEHVMDMGLSEETKFLKKITF
ncbi:chaperone protein [Diplodia corticola]|uniref:Chaperone protein n=1 Tax=Diplodia corticola TaxID=236234 RepID=A0A1J9RRT3_9PEZI|nr:chaperone protein [Diplodia corticola]OJD30604.1 chaperone protein [Diplodia corticola]